MANIFYNPESRLSPVHYFCLRSAAAMVMLWGAHPKNLLPLGPSQSWIIFAVAWGTLGGVVLSLGDRWRRVGGVITGICILTGLLWRGPDLLLHRPWWLLLSICPAFLSAAPKHEPSIRNPNRAKCSCTWGAVFAFLMLFSLAWSLRNVHMLNNIAGALDWDLRTGFSPFPIRQLKEDAVLLAIQLGFLLLTPFRRTRFLTWPFMVALPLNNFFYLSLRNGYPAWANLPGPIITSLLLAFCFNPSWLPPKRPSPSGKHVVFHDGFCGMCNWFIQLLWVEDLSSVLHFSPLQGNTAKAVLERHPDLEGVDAVIYVRDFELPTEEVFTKSDAVMYILRDVGGFWRPVSWLWLLPQWLRDGVYDFIAKGRTRWFKPLDSCPTPKPELAERFLP